MDAAGPAVALGRATGTATVRGCELEKPTVQSDCADVGDAAETDDDDGDVGVDGQQKPPTAMPKRSVTPTRETTTMPTTM